MALLMNVNPETNMACLRRVEAAAPRTSSSAMRSWCVPSSSTRPSSHTAIQSLPNRGQPMGNHKNRLFETLGEPWMNPSDDASRRTCFVQNQHVGTSTARAKATRCAVPRSISSSVADLGVQSFGPWSVKSHVRRSAWRNRPWSVVGKRDVFRHRAVEQERVLGHR